LAELWIQYKNDDNFADFMQYNDLGMPLAYAISNGIIEVSKQATLFVEETFATFMWALSDKSVIEPEDDDDDIDYPQAWMGEEFSTLEEVFMFFGTNIPE
jgi:hypothetical protein